MRSWNVRVYAVVIAAGLTLMFATPLRALWLRESAPWWSVFVLWGIAAVALFVLARVPQDRDEPPPPSREPRP